MRGLCLRASHTCIQAGQIFGGRVRHGINKRVKDTIRLLCEVIYITKHVFRSAPHPRQHDLRQLVIPNTAIDKHMTSSLEHIIFSTAKTKMIEMLCLTKRNLNCNSCCESAQYPTPLAWNGMIPRLCLTAFRMRINYHGRHAQLRRGLLSKKQ